ncbi:SpoIIE family protein phosphatase [Streptomyces rubrogriseus]|uniref:SpoIIE family protein phosphatase n=1 Tax=Streptomyces rubrogriseus TaxID=194673 RepID=UPI00379E0C1F
MRVALVSRGLRTSSRRRSRSSRRAGWLTVVDCGHHPPLPLGDPVHLITPAKPGLPPGLGAGPRPRTVKLQTGQRLPFCNDGLVEARDARGRMRLAGAGNASAGSPESGRRAQGLAQASGRPGPSRVDGRRRRPGAVRGHRHLRRGSVPLPAGPAGPGDWGEPARPHGLPVARQVGPARRAGCRAGRAQRSRPARAESGDGPVHSTRI